jgi:hypothetical protein
MGAVGADSAHRVLQRDQAALAVVSNGRFAIRGDRLRRDISMASVRGRAA